VREPRSSRDPRVDALALALVPRVGPRQYRERIIAHGSAAEAFSVAVAWGERDRLRDEARGIVHAGDACRARLVLLEDADYPRALLDLTDPPPFLFVYGDLALLSRPTVAIVGTRRATPYGDRVTESLAGALATAGICIVSGLARGIDGAAHRAALARGGATAAVLGTGVDIAYPVGHRALHRTIAERGVVVSEFPCGTRPEPGSFPRRNRIIAALAQLTIVVEAGERSGASITANHATDLGRDVGAVPGPVDSPQSVRTNLLIQQGAHPILAPRDAFLLLGIADPDARRPDATLALAGDERTIWTVLEDGATPLDLLPERVALPTNRTLAAVTALEVAGLIETLPTGELRRRRD
jgi:DNA processing protein